jgi:hypothetical protein
MMDGAYSTFGGRVEVHTGFWWENLRERDNFEDPGIDGRIILRWIFRKWYVTAWTGSMWLRQGQVTGSCGCGNKPSGSIKYEKFLDQLRTSQLLNKDSAL